MRLQKYIPAISTAMFTVMAVFSASIISSGPVMAEDALAGLRFGAVEITVHDGRIVQIERREKFRFESTVVKTAAERS